MLMISWSRPAGAAIRQRKDVCRTFLRGTAHQGKSAVSGLFAGVSPVIIVSILITPGTLMSSSTSRPAVKKKSSKPAAASVVDPAKELLWARPGFLVRRLHQIHVAMFFEECKSSNTTPVQYAILSALAVMPGLDQTALGQEVGLDRTTTADVVRRLEERGLLERRENEADRRTRHVFLTREGKSAVNAMHADMVRAQERMLSPLTDAQQKTFMKLVSQLVEANNQYSRAALRS
jgi:DNA-binding MarR family transcriptional regulator